MFRIVLIAASVGLVLSACYQPDPAAPAPTPEPAMTVDPEPESDPSASGHEDDSDPAAAIEDIETVGYPEGWEIQLYWSGEYPNAFSVTGPGVTVMGHEAITFEEYPPIYCGLPATATYCPWNRIRNESDSVDYVSMVFPTTFTIEETVTLQVLVGDGEEALTLNAGDELIYKSYLAEGFFIAEKDGILYEMNEADLPRSTVFEEGPDDQEWVRVTCDDAEQTRAWILLDDALATPGIERYDYTGFGEAADLP